MSLKTKSALLSVMLCILLIFALFFVITNLDSVHSGVTFADPPTFSGVGSGTSESPYQIRSNAQMQEF